MYDWKLVREFFRRKFLNKLEIKIQERVGKDYMSQTFEFFAE